MVSIVLSESSRAALEYAKRCDSGPNFFLSAVIRSNRSSCYLFNILVGFLLENFFSQTKKAVNTFIISFSEVKNTCKLL